MADAQKSQTPQPLKGRITVIDDEENMVKILTRVLRMENYHVTGFTNPQQAAEHIANSPPDLVLTDVRMPEMSGVEILNATKAANPATNVIIMTAYATIDGAIEAMRGGAFDYVRKPFNTDELLMTVARALQNTRLVEENESLSDTLTLGSETSILGQSEAIRHVISTITKIAPSDAAVLVRGESGTGKELVARAIHEQSPRRTRRFVAINCASIPENLLESELFGHEKGSFTGADRAKMGLVELAHNGTLFLDEIGELPLTLQAKLLRVLQEREIQRVGGLYPIPVDIRLIAATNRDLKQAIDRKEFRADLFYRLDVISIEIPTLRNRKGDVPILAKHFLDRSARKLRKPNITITPQAMQALENYSYPGNVRELENIIERTVVLSGSDLIGLMDLPADVRIPDAAMIVGAATALPVEYKDAKDAFEREYMLRIIDAAHGNISEAARMSGISRRHFYEKLEKLNIKTER